MKINIKKIYIFLLSLYFVCLPLGTLRIGSFGSLLKIIGILPIIVCIISRNKLKFNKTSSYYLIYIMMALLSCIWSINRDNTFGRVVTYAEFYILMLSVGFFEYTEKEVNIFKKSLVWSSRITLILLLVFGTITENRLVLRGIIKEDPNYICMYFSFGVLFAIEKIKDSKVSKVYKLIAIAELIIYYYTVFMTGSRGGLLAIAVCSFVMIILNNHKLKNTIINHFKKVLIILGVIIIIVNIVGVLDPVLVERFSIDSVVESGGTGRTEIWTNGLNMFANTTLFRQFFGFGSATIIQAFILHGYSMAKVMHNVYLEQLLDLGIIGFTLYMLYLFKFVKSAWKFENKYSLCLMIGFMAMALSTSLSAFKPFINAMIFIVIQENILKEGTDDKIALK